MKTNRRLALERRNSKSGNPMQYDQQFLDLIECLDTVKTNDVFERWLTKFLDRYQDHTGEQGCEKATIAYASFGVKVEGLVHAVGKLAKHINEEKISRNKVAVKSRNTISEVSRCSQIVNIELFGLVPATSVEENISGYNKYHMVQVLIRDNFMKFERFNICKNVLHTFRFKILDEVADRQVLASINDCDRAINRFFLLLQDLGVHRIMTKSRELNAPRVAKELLAELSGINRRVGNLTEDHPEQSPPFISDQNQSSTTKRPFRARAPLEASLSHEGHQPEVMEQVGCDYVTRKTSRKQKSSSLPDGRQKTNDSAEKPRKKRSNFHKGSRKKSLSSKNDAMKPENVRSCKPVSESSLLVEEGDEDELARCEEDSTNRKATKKKLPTVPGTHKSRAERSTKTVSVQTHLSTASQSLEGAAEKLKSDVEKTRQGLVVIVPKKKTKSKDSHNDADEDGKSVLRISSKKKAELKVIQVRKGKQDIKRGMRDKKDALKKQRGRASQKERDSSQTTKEVKDADKSRNLDAGAPTSDGNNKGRTTEGDVEGEYGGTTEGRAAKKDSTNESQTQKPKKVTSIAEFLEQGNQGRAKSGARSVVSEPAMNHSAWQRKENTDDSQSLLMQLPSSLNAMSSASGKVSVRRISSIGPHDYVGRRTQASDKITQLTSLSKEGSSGTAFSAQSNSNIRGLVRAKSSSASVPDKRQIKGVYQWAARKPANIDDSASRLADKRLPPKPNSNKQGSKRQPKSTKNWPSSLLEIPLDEEEDEEEELLPQPDAPARLNDEAHRPSGAATREQKDEDFSFATLHKKFLSQPSPLKASKQPISSSSPSRETKLPHLNVAELATFPTSLMDQVNRRQSEAPLEDKEVALDHHLPQKASKQPISSSSPSQETKLPHLSVAEIETSSMSPMDQANKRQSELPAAPLEDKNVALGHDVTTADDQNIPLIFRTHKPSNSIAKPQSRKISDLLSENDDGFCLDGSNHDPPHPGETSLCNKSPDATLKFKPVSSWASPAGSQSGKSREAIKKKKAVVGAIRPAGKSKMDRMKPHMADDSSVVKVKKGRRNLGELTVEKTAGKQRKKLKAKSKTSPNGEQVPKGWLNPFDPSAPAQHFEISTC